MGNKMKEKLTELIVSRYYRGLKETVIPDKCKFVVIEYTKSIELCRYDNGDKNPYFAREPINIELENLEKEYNKLEEDLRNL